jgi:preprotein translocase SecE subunit
MESQFQKWVNLSYLATAALLGYLVFALSTKLVGVYDLETRVHSIGLVLQIAAVVIAGIAFLILYRNDDANQFMNEVMLELSRVSWPTTKETSSSTVVVMIMVLISGLILGFFDYLWVSALKWLL